MSLCLRTRVRQARVRMLYQKKRFRSFAPTSSCSIRNARSCVQRSSSASKTFINGVSATTVTRSCEPRLPSSTTPRMTLCADVRPSLKRNKCQARSAGHCSRSVAWLVCNLCWLLTTDRRTACAADGDVKIRWWWSWLMLEHCCSFAVNPLSCLTVHVFVWSYVGGYILCVLFFSASYYGNAAFYYRGVIYLAYFIVT